MQAQGPASGTGPSVDDDSAANLVAPESDDRSHLSGRARAKAKLKKAESAVRTKVTPNRPSNPLTPIGENNLAEREIAQSELDNIRKAAENWIKGVTALLGLFSVSGIVFGQQTLKDLDGYQEVCGAGLLVVALILAAAAIFMGYHAAYGWPSARNLRSNVSRTEAPGPLGTVFASGQRPIASAIVESNLKEFYRDTYQRTWQAVMALRISVFCSMAALLVLAVAMFLIVFLWS